MENPKASAVARLKEANNVLVTVSNNPSVDQLAGAIGLTLLLNKLGKHATAVFSGQTPSTIEFLQPEQTLESNTDSLRDFIIALDKSKADKLRYKVEEKQVKIFITPYRTSIGQEDLEFSHGDFNVDVVVALGVHEQQDLDQAITAHGRILHDATIMTINTQPNGSLGSITWVDPQASSLCEMLAELGVTLKSDVFDAQMATALLTGIVAETDRFSNQRTTSITMSISAKLMAAGANQQLVATKLQEAPEAAVSEEAAQTSSEAENEGTTASDNDENNNSDEDGALRIDHNQPDDGGGDENGGQAQDSEEDQADEKEEAAPSSEESAGEDQEAHDSTPPEEDQHTNALPDTPRIMMEPPSMGGTLTASALPEDAGSSVDPLNLPPVSMPLLSHDAPVSASEPPAAEPVVDDNQSQSQDTAQPEPPTTAADNQDGQATAATDSQDDQTLADIEQAVESPHVDQPEEKAEPLDASVDLDAARDAVTQAVAGDENAPLEPIAALGAQPVNLDLGHNDSKAVEDSAPQAQAEPPAATTQANDYFDITKLDESTGLPADSAPPSDVATDGQAPAQVNNLNPPPPVPPPMMPPPPPTMTFGEQPLPNQEDDNQAQDPLAPI